ncbi:MAG TPA: hypothetical protein VNX01_15010 [Bacteroidia bacterium]|nr:hypothetical protein [Bacteroidia bacterium]
MFDTITVNASVVDNEHLSYINVVLTDANHTPLQASYSIPITSAGFTFNIRYPLTQYHLQTGNYLMQITADDGYNTITSYQPIYITESPTLLWGYCTVLKNNPQTINQIDTAGGGSISPIVLSQAYNGMKYGAYYQQLFVNGKGIRPFQSFYLQPQAANQLSYSESATVNQLDYTSLYTDGTRPYVGFLNSDIYSFDNVGSYGTSYRLNDINFYPYLFTKTSNYGVGVFKSKNVTANGSDKIVSFTGFGAFSNSTPIPNFTVVAMFEKGNDSLCVLGNNSANQAEGYVYSIPNGGSTALTGILPINGKMSSAVKVNNNCFAFSVGSFTYLYYYSTPNYDINVPVSAQKLVYQPKLNRLTAASSTSSSGVLAFYTVNVNSLTLMRWPLSFNDSIIDFEVITNK